MPLSDAAMDSLYHIIYPLPEPNQTRTRPLEIMCLGLSRSGTESLKRALELLGCEKVYHGFNVPENPGHAIVWCRLGFAKEAQHESSDSSVFTARSFDRMIGDCDAVTDIPCATFGPELLQAYPNAKVILNRRTDEEAWVRSIRQTLLPLQTSWPFWFKCFFNAEMFWVRRCFDACFAPAVQHHRWTPDDAGSKSAKQIYREHYLRLETIMRREGRDWLGWGVQDGWAPLCEFLGKDVPQGIEFPTGNDPQEFVVRRERIYVERMRRMRRNMWITGGLAGVGLAAVVARVMTRIK